MAETHDKRTETHACDLISRQAAIDIERNATVDTNPSHFEAHQKFTQFLDDAEVSSFGRWQWANGFNTALTAVGIDLKKLPSAQQWIPCSERLPYAEYGESDTVLTTCGYRDVEDTSVRWIRLLYFNGGNWCYPTGETYEAKVYAWCPLPEPYKEHADAD